MSLNCCSVKLLLRYLKNKTCLIILSCSESISNVNILSYRDGDKMAPTVEKKISELEMGLLHLQQNIDIPEITLPIHPNVLAVLKKCQEENRKAKVEDFGDKVEDAQFLNALQSGVNRWIREIQKVSSTCSTYKLGVNSFAKTCHTLILKRTCHQIFSFFVFNVVHFNF